LAGHPKPFTPEGTSVNLSRWWSLPISPDGQRIIGSDEHGTSMLYRIDGGRTEPIPGLKADEVAVQWTADGRGLLVAHGEGLPWIVERLDLATGQRTPAATIRAHDPAGLRLSVF
jgi:hypothetical protein